MDGERAVSTRYELRPAREVAGGDARDRELEPWKSAISGQSTQGVRIIPVRSQAFGPRRLTAHSAAGEAMAAAMRSAHAAIWSGSSGPETFTALAALLNWRVLLSMAPRTSVMLARMSSSWEELGPATFA